MLNMLLYTIGPPLDDACHLALEAQDAKASPCAADG